MTLPKNFPADAVAVFLGLLLSYVGVVFALLGGLRNAYEVGTLLVLAYVMVIFYVVRKARARSHAPFLLALPMFLVTAVLELVQVGRRVASLATPDSASFALACKATGAQFFKKPSAPVHSVAHDWADNEEPSFNEFTVRFGTRITSFQWSNFPYPKDIEFVERKISRNEGAPRKGAEEPFRRFPRDGNYYGIPHLTADVLLYSQLTPKEELQKAKIDQGIVHYALSVKDRRTGETLAVLRYVVDAKGGRACGLTSDNTMSERAFVLRAIGLAP